MEVTIRGPINPESGMVMNLDDLSDIMIECIMKPLDHKNIDKDVPFFENVTSTVENVAVFIWDSMILRLDKPELLFKIRIWENDESYVTYHGV